MARRFTIEEKKALLEKFYASGEKQMEFCRSRGLGQPMFSKWMKHADQILHTPNFRKNREPKTEKAEAYAVLCERLAAMPGTGMVIDVASVMREAEMLCPALLAGLDRYNSRYQLCSRLLHDVLPAQAQRCVTAYEGDSSDDTTAPVPPWDLKGFPLSSLYTHVKENMYTEVDEASARAVDD